MFNTVSNKEMKTVQESRGLQKAQGESLKNHSSSHAVAVHTTPGRCETAFSLRKRIICFLCTLRRRKLETKQSLVISVFLFEENSGRETLKRRHFRKVPFLKCSLSTLK